MNELQVTNTELLNFTRLEDSDIEQAQFIFSAVGEAAPSVSDNYVRRYLKEGIDYGTIPGCGNKKVLMKAGSEKFCILFKLRPRFELVDSVTDYQNNLFHYHYRCSLYRFGELVGQCDGIANSRESKFNRKVLTCPKCGSTESVFRDKKTDNYYCWAKKGGCGATNLSKNSVNSGNTSFDYNSVNTIAKMSIKRSPKVRLRRPLVGAVLIVCGISQYFTQDLEDYR
jgi:hypothetical protein